MATSTTFYIPVEYIESTGTQYINTGVNPNQNTGFEMDFIAKNPITSGGYGDYFGASVSNRLSLNTYPATSGGELYIQNAAFNPYITQDVRKQITYKNSTFSDNEGHTYTVSKTFSVAQPIYVFNRNINGTPSIVGGSLRLYSLKLYDGDTLIRDFVPVIDSDGTACLFDKENNVAYYNQGSGMFKAGKINGSYIGIQTTFTPIEYIESTGTQFINTGYTPLAHDKIVVDCLVKLNDTKAYEALFGSRDGSYAHNAYIFFTRFNASNIPTYNRSGAETQGSNMIYNERITLTTQDSVATWTNGTNTYTCTTTGTVEDCVYPLYVFDLNKGSQDGSLSQVKLYSLKIYDENDNLVRDFIPVLYSDGVAGLWENVEGRPYYNQGTGEFLYPEANTNDYDVLDYIESSGTQYLNIGFYANNNTRVEAEAMPTNISGGESWQALFSSKTGYHNKEYVVQVDKSAAKWYTAFGGTSSSFTAVTNNYNYYIDKNKNITTINGAINSLSSSTFTATQPMYIFTDNESGPTHYFRGRLFWLKVYDDETLIRDLIPVKRKSDDKVCMYDLVNNQFYTNAGTGVFAGGDVVGTRGTPIVLYLARRIKKGYVGATSTYTPVEYIESSGTQYIDTGVPASSTLKTLCDMSTTAGGYPFGVTPAQNVKYYGAAVLTTNQRIQSYFGTTSSYTTINNVWTQGQRFVLTANDNYKFYKDSTQIADYTTGTTKEFDNSLSITIFALNGLYLSSRITMKLYGFKMYDGGTLVRDFIPVVNDNNVACLYDLVEGKFYYNKGSGTFIAGNTTGEPVYIGSVARKIKKGYVGVNGVARKLYVGSYPI